MTKSSSHCRSSERERQRYKRDHVGHYSRALVPKEVMHMLTVYPFPDSLPGGPPGSKRAPGHALLPPDNTTWVARPAVHATKFIIVAGQQRVCTCYMYSIIRVISPQAISLTSALNKGWAYNTSRAYIRIYHMQASYTYTRTLSWRGGGLVIHHGLIIRTIR